MSESACLTLTHPGAEGVERKRTSPWHLRAILPLGFFTIDELDHPS
jgi:hypothetical protein